MVHPRIPLSPVFLPLRQIPTSRSIRALSLINRQFPQILSTNAYTTSTSPSTSPPIVFNRQHKILQKNRAAKHPNSRTVDYVKDEIAERLVDRLLDIKRTFNTVLDLGSGAGHVIKHLDSDLTKELIMLDSAEHLLHRDDHIHATTHPTLHLRKLHSDEENFLQTTIPPSSLDCIISSLSLHWVNDIPGTLIQSRKSLKPDSPFLGAMFGGDTLYELRTSLQLAELERTGGLGVHVSPMTDIRDVGALLSRAGFVLTTMDIDEVCVSYPSMMELVEDLNAMGEGNAVALRTNKLSRDTLLAASSIYKELYGNADGTIPATFQVYYMIGWSPDPTSQPKPKERGSAKVSFKSLETGGEK